MTHSEQQKEQLSSQIEDAETKVEVGAEYAHFKDPIKRYEVVCLGVIESTNETCVVYRALHGRSLVWVRTLKDFTSKVKLEDGTEVDRFTKVV